MKSEQGPLFSEELAPDHRSGFVALIGKPNVGKSTLLNAWLGTKIAAVSPKPQTTRNRLLGILTRPDAQVIFVDTPGVHRARTKLGDYMVNAAKRAVPDADVVFFVVDVSGLPSSADYQVAQLLEDPRGIPVILVLNKADLVPEEKMAQHKSAYEALGQFGACMSISALTGYNRDKLLNLAIARLPLGPRFYPEDQLTDQQERFIAAELIREQALRFLEQEVPHALAIVVQEFKERANGVIYISANIYVEKESQKGIVIGRHGTMLKHIGSEGRIALEQFFGCKVFLDLWVKVRKNWRSNENYLRQLGYNVGKRR